MSTPTDISKDFDGSIVNLVESSGGSAGMLVNLLAHHFDCFRDAARYDGRKVHIMKRAQILVADLWAAFDGEGYGHFEDIDKVTMFAGKKVPLILHHIR